ncbi:hypothetical protein A5747_21820 [Mycobacterium sp. IS-836]|nr:hypothetical protein A5747_21820 [Mycobacterium sp. IS-836]
MRFLYGIVRTSQVIEDELHIRVLDRLLENLAIHLKDGSPDRFGLAHYSTDRPLQGIGFYRALDFHEQTELPLRAGVSRFLRKPNV